MILKKRAKNKIFTLINIDTKKNLWEYIGNIRKGMIVILPKYCKLKNIVLIILSFFISLENIVLAIFTSKSIYFLIHNEIKNLLIISILALISLILILLIKLYFQKLKNSVISDINNNTRKEIYNYQMNHINKDIPISFYINDIKFLEENLYEKIFEQYINVFSVVLSVILSFFLGFVPTLVIVSISAMSIYVPKFFQEKLNDLSNKFILEGENYTNTLKDIINGKNTIKNHSAEHFFSQKQEKASNNLENANINLKNLQKKSQYLTFATSHFSVISMIIVSSYFIAKMKMEVGNIIGIIQISNSIIFPVISYLQNKTIISSTKDTLKKQSKNREIYLNTENISKKFNTITFKNVCYKINDNVILDDINVSIKKGDKILVTGVSGSGKSTFLSVFSSANNLDLTGEILLDNKEIYYKDLKNYATNIMQNIFIFSDTLENNILFGKSYKNFLDTIKNSKLDDILDRFSNNEIIKENGKNLSGGQKQRIEIARSLCKEKDILIIDEGFSSLDFENLDKIEQKILENKDLTLFNVTYNINEKSYNKYDKIFEISNKTITVKEIK